MKNNLRNVPGNARLRVRCEGSGTRPAPSTVDQPYPTCDTCGRDFGWQGRKNAWRNSAARQSLPDHYRPFAYGDQGGGSDG